VDFIAATGIKVIVDADARSAPIPTVLARCGNGERGDRRCVQYWTDHAKDGRYVPRNG